MSTDHWIKLDGWPKLHLSAQAEILQGRWRLVLSPLFPRLQSVANATSTSSYCNNVQ
jgi:hypothetical protein